MRMGVGVILRKISLAPWELARAFSVFPRFLLRVRFSSLAKSGKRRFFHSLSNVPYLFQSSNPPILRSFDSKLLSYCVASPILHCLLLTVCCLFLFSSSVKAQIAVAFSTPSYPANGAFVSTATPNFNWIGPSTDVVTGLGAGASFYLEVDNNSDFASREIFISTPVNTPNPVLVTVDGGYISTFPLVADTTYYWR